MFLIMNLYEERGSQCILEVGKCYEIFSIPISHQSWDFCAFPKDPNVKKNIWGHWECKLIQAKLPQHIAITKKGREGKTKHIYKHCHSWRKWKLPINLWRLEGAGVVVKGLVGALLRHRVGDVQAAQQPLWPVARRVWMSLKGKLCLKPVWAIKETPE